MLAELEALEEIKPLLEARTFAYDMLRRTFLQEPSREYLALIGSEGFLNAFPFQDDDGLILDGIGQVQKFVTKNDLLSESAYDRLRWDYTRLFIGPNKLPAPPWESVYVLKERLLFQEVTLQVRQSYLEYGFLPKAYRQEADDHVGLELDFMYQLAMLTCASGSKLVLNKLLEDQKMFLTGHLLRWVPDFSRCVAENAQTGFYQGMAKILHGFLLLDRQALTELMAE